MAPIASIKDETMDICNVIIDLSRNNPNVDFHGLGANNIIGIIHKATQGSGFSDPVYVQRREAAKNAGLLWGAYHFGPIPSHKRIFSSRWQALHRWIWSFWILKRTRRTRATA